MGRRVRPLEAAPGGFRRIAVLRLSSLGDVILTLPAVRALHRAFPGARIEYWTKEEYADVVRFDPHVAHVRRLEREARGLEDLLSMSAELEDCDLIVDLHGSARARVLTFRQKARVLRVASHRLRRARLVHARWSRPRPAPHALERYAEALAPLGIAVEGVPQVAAGEEAERWASGWLADFAPAEAPVALCPGARHATKRWPEEHWVALDAELARRRVPRLCFSLPAERDALGTLAQRVAQDPAARWCTEPLPRMAALLSRCRAAVTCDSGLMHLAAARGVPVAAMFGSTSPVLGFAPAGAGHEVLCRNEPCQPCTLHGRERCPQRHFRCMIELGPEPVLAALDRIGERSARRA
ncbi:MAG TPA: glycosyltransferase family 9 protein [Candidatus Eisenbacteria bacterium]|jgi:heptosyltransferase-2